MPRQNGKGSIIEALELAWLFLFEVELIFHSAHLFATSQDAFRRIKQLIRNTPDLDDQVLKYSASHGQEGIELRSGQRLQFVARSKSGGRGFPAPVVVLDEAFNLSKQAVAALVPTMAAQAEPFLLYASSAPIDDACSDELRGFMRRSRTGEVERRCYIEYCADPDADLETQLDQANPGRGIRLNEDVITLEREVLSPEAFLIERLGIVDVTNETAQWRVVPVGPWSQCERDEHKPTGSLRYALDADTNAKGELWVSIGVSDGTHVELVTPPNAIPGFTWVVPAVVEKRSVVGELVVDPDGPAGALIDDLEAAGIPVRKLKAQERQQAASQFLQAVLDLRLRHVDQAALNIAAAGADRRDVGDGAWTWSRTRSEVDISPLNAVTYARWAAAVDDSTPPNIY